MTESIQYSFIGSAPEPWLVGVADPYEDRAASSWRVSMSFASAAGRLRGLYKGSFRGIEVLARGVSPRIVSALVLGSAGNGTVSGPELAGRLNLMSAWAYFSVRNGAGIRREPDRSGRSSQPVPEPTPPPSPAGGAQAPTPPVSAAAAGGVAAR
jgi:stage II sporulation protein D